MFVPVMDIRLYRKPSPESAAARPITRFPIKSIWLLEFETGDGAVCWKARHVAAPCRAAPADRLPESIGRQENALRVGVDGESWAVGVNPGKFSQWSRPLHGDYVETPSYRALFLASLLLSGQDRVDVLVTGLPVSQWLDVSN